LIIVSFLAFVLTNRFIGVILSLFMVVTVDDESGRHHLSCPLYVWVPLEWSLLLLELLFSRVHLLLLLLLLFIVSCSQ
jgi:hypothetical protein